MKGYLGCIAVKIQNFIKFKKYLVGEICQEVLTLHLLTITLRRNSNPPGFFRSYAKRGRMLQNVNKMLDIAYKYFEKQILLINLLPLRLFNIYGFERGLRNLNKTKLGVYSWGRVSLTT